MSNPYILRFHPDIEQDLQKIVSWYEKRQYGLGNDFLQTFYSSTDLILENPLKYPKKYKNFRRYLLRKFPYVLYYVIKGEYIIIMGVFHHARDPKVIKSTLRYRKE